jgi:hypothetical protein
MTWMAQCLGGPLDGTYHPVMGEQLRYPGPPPRYDYFSAAPDSIPLELIFPVGSYELQRGDDGQYLYIHKDHPR